MKISDKKNIVLIGMMGAGKTFIAKNLLKILKDFSLLDIDLEIEKNQNMTISEIFEKYGENHFRNLERKIIEQNTTCKNLIISLGGGAFEDKINQKNLKENGIIFYLKTDEETLFNRIKNEDNRPLLKTENPFETLKKLLQKREKNYLKADFVIQTDNKTVDIILDEIIKNYEKK